VPHVESDQEYCKVFLSVRTRFYIFKLVERRFYLLKEEIKLGLSKCLTSER